jgi:hypothetical protein
VRGKRPGGIVNVHQAILLPAENVRRHNQPLNSTGFCSAGGDIAGPANRCMLAESSVAATISVVVTLRVTNLTRSVKSTLMTHS